VVAWGENGSGQCNVPPLPAGLSYVEVAAAGGHSVARRSNGSVVAWGDNTVGQCVVPALPPGLSYVALAAGGGFYGCGYYSCPYFGYTLARRSDGTVVAWGDNYYGQCNVPALPAGLSYVEIAAGRFLGIARRSDGAIVAWENNAYGQCNAPIQPAGVAYVEVAAGSVRSVALVEGSPSFTSSCDPGVAGVVACPCSNPPAAPGRGCQNSSSTGGAALSAAGRASLASDTVVFTTAGERPTATSILVQGHSLIPGGATIGEGVRCSGGVLKRLYVRTAIAGSITAPQAGDPSVSTRSAFLGDAILAGTPRHYQVYYRDPIVLGGCAPALAFNVTQQIDVLWNP